jgi:hypothetical protein
MFFDPQVHTLRGVEFTTFMPGFVKAIRVRLFPGGSPPPVCSDHHEINKNGMTPPCSIGLLRQQACPPAGISAKGGSHLPRKHECGDVAPL